MTIEQTYLKTRRLMSLRRQTLRVAIDSVALMILLGRRDIYWTAIDSGPTVVTWSRLLKHVNRKQGEDIRGADVRGGTR